MTNTVSGTVLVLNQNYEPLNICNVRRAIVLVIDGKAEVLEEYNLALRSACAEFASPSVIRLVYMIKRPRPKVKLTRKEIFIRDDHTCQYCGKRTGDLTLDHIHPRSKGGQHTWLNLVSACRFCNHRKGGKSLAEARMQLAPGTVRAEAGCVLHHRTSSRIRHTSRLGEVFARILTHGSLRRRIL